MFYIPVESLLDIWTLKLFGAVPGSSSCTVYGMSHSRGLSVLAKPEPKRISAQEKENCTGVGADTGVSKKLEWGERRLEEFCTKLHFKANSNQFFCIWIA